MDQPFYVCLIAPVVHKSTLLTTNIKNEGKLTRSHDCGYSLNFQLYPLNLRISEKDKCHR